MAWMTAGPVKVLMGIGRFGVQVSANFAVTIDYLNVKKRDTCSRFGLFKLDVWIKRITEVKEVSKFFFTVSPYKEDVDLLTLTWDVKSLYTNIPHDGGIEALHS